MAETVHLFLKANGSDIQGESTQTSLDREGSIECVYFESEVLTAREAGSGMATGRRQFQPITIRKRIDKSTPLLAKALANNEVIEGEFRFYRPSPAGDGTTEQFYTISIAQGRVSNFRMLVPDTIVPATSTQPPLEEIKFIFAEITWTYVPTGAMHHDSWKENQ